MKIKYGNVEIVCDRVTETDGKLSIWQDGMVIREISNIPPSIDYKAIDGVIEHVLTPYEEALEDINDLQADLAEKVEQYNTIMREYIEVLADDEAKRSRLERIESLIQGLGDGMTLTKLVQFVKDLKAIIAETVEVNNGEDQL